jgi:hypothetical protein
MSTKETPVPRMLHKTVDPDPASPANRLRVDTQDELAAALKDGWVLSAGDTKAAKAEAKAEARAEK